jgi:hypothetical protein
MLRRYLIVNGTSTALLYGALHNLISFSMNLLKSAQTMFEGFAMQSPILAPLVNKVVVVFSSL